MSRNSFPTDVLELAAELVSRPSRNTMGHARPDGTQKEFALWLADLLASMGASQVQTTEPGEGLMNVFAAFDFGCEETIVYTAHLDTVPPMSGPHDHWFGQTQENCLWGRGACDDKGPMAAMLAAIGQTVRKRETEPPKRNVLFVATCDEEHGFGGVRHVLETTPELLNMIRGQKPMGCFAAEPTECKPILAHKGVTRWRVVARGQAAHSSTPFLGVNAITRMAKFVLQIERKNLEMNDNGPHHPLLGAGTLSPGVITGGTAVNIVPDLCVLELDRRLLPGETPESAGEELKNIASACGVSLDEPYMFGLPLETPAKAPVALLACRAAQHAGGDAAPGYVNYATDGAFFAAAGLPTVIIGPGNIAQAHTKDEFIEVSQLRTGQALFEAGLQL